MYIDFGVGENGKGNWLKKGMNKGRKREEGRDRRGGEWTDKNRREEKGVEGKKKKRKKWERKYVNL